jgi:hypothetical protein
MWQKKAGFMRLSVYRPEMRFLYFMHAMVNDHPTMAGEYGRCAAADLQYLPGIHGRGQSVVRIEEARLLWLMVVLRHGAIRDPEAFVIQIYESGFAFAHGFLRQRAREERTVQQGQLELPSMIGHGHGKDASVEWHSFKAQCR